MKKKSTFQSAFFNLRVVVGAFLVLSAAMYLHALTRERARHLDAQMRGANPAPFAPSGTVQEAWVARYNGPLNAVDMSFALVVDGSGNVYVTGRSHGAGSDYDYATVKYNASGQQLWIARYSGPYRDLANAIAVDGSGNVYVTGQSEPVFGSNIYDYVTIKYDASGAELWIAHYNGPGNDDDVASAIAVDGSGNVYVTGRSTGSGANFDYATIKYNASGTEEWVARYDGPGNAFDFAAAIAVDGGANVYVTGQSVGPAPLNSVDYATIKYNASGTEQWVARYDGPDNSADFATGIALDGSGNVYVTGGSTSGAYDYATIKYNPSGAEQWAARYNGPGNLDDSASAVALDASANVYVTGNSAGSGTSLDYATIKYDTSGAEQWVARYNGPGNFNDDARAIAVDGSGNSYVTGASTGSGGIYDYATIKYDAAGVEQWVARYNGPGNLIDFARGIGVDGSGNVYVTGESLGSGTNYDYATIKYVQGATPTPTPCSPTPTPVGCGLVIGSGLTIGYEPHNYTTLANNIVNYTFANSQTTPNDFAIFETHDPWGGTVIKDAITAAGHTYSVFTPAELTGFPFSDYRVIILNWDDELVPGFDPPYTATIPALEAYVNAGGVVWVQGAIHPDGGESYPLPFGGQANYDPSPEDFILDACSPIVTGVPNPIVGDSASHVSMSGLPANAHVVATRTDAFGPPVVYDLRGPCGTPTPTPTATPTATATPSGTPRPTPTPRPRGTPHPRPTP
jgi:Beta-propeller repeat